MISINFGMLKTKQCITRPKIVRAGFATPESKRQRGFSRLRRMRADRTIGIAATLRHTSTHHLHISLVYKVEFQKK
jgi:hypothetical protein